MKKFLLSSVAISLIAICSLTYADCIYETGGNCLIAHDITGHTITVYDTGLTYGVTIQDTNLGTTTPGTGEASYGYYFQWGNNHGNYAGTNTGTQDELLEANVNDWVNKGYSGNNDKFIIFKNGNKNTYDYRSGAYYTSDSNNSYRGIYATGPYNNLWGGGSDNEEQDNVVKGYNTEMHTATNTGGRQGPCPTDYHVPSAGERNELVKLYANAKGYTLKDQSGEYSWAKFISNVDVFRDDMLLPPAGNRDLNYGPAYNTGTIGFYWSSSPYSGSLAKYVLRFMFNSEQVNPSGGGYRAAGLPIRCFKNSYVEPAPSTFTITFTGSGQGSISTGSIEVEEGTSISRDDGAGSVTISGTVVATGLANEGYVFSGWLTDCGATVTTACNFTGDFKPITYTISFSGNAADVTGTVPAIINAEYDSGDIAPDNSFTLTGYTFTGWNTESDGTGTGYATGAELKNLTTTSGADVVLYAQWEANIHKLSFVVDGTTIQSGDVAYSTAISAPADPTKDSCNSFAGWTSSVEGLTTTGTMPDSDVTFTANWNYTCSRSSGGGGGGSSKTTTTNTTGTVTTGTNETNVKSDTQDEEIQEDEDEGEIQEDKDEFQRAYEFAYKHGITTMPTIEKANMTGTLTRIAMAKMLSYYAINILGMKPDETRVNKFNDVSEKLDAEYNNGVTLAYQLGIMGINMPKNNFRPNDLVTRGEFATALSRMLYGIADGKDKYYSTHLAKLMEEKIITNDDPKMKELRGYVMIMLMRSAENKSTEN